MANQSEMATIGAFLSQNANTTLLDGVSMRSSGKLTVIYLFFLGIYKFDLGSVTTNTFNKQNKAIAFNRQWTAKFIL